MENEWGYSDQWKRYSRHDFTGFREDEEKNLALRGMLMELNQWALVSCMADGDTVESQVCQTFLAGETTWMATPLTKP